MSKNYDVRLEEIYAYVANNFSPSDRKNVEAKVAKSIGEQADLEFISNSLSLGMRVFHKDAETTRRQAVRALCFISALSLGTAPTSVDAIVKAKKKFSTVDCNRDLAVLLNNLKPQQKAAIAQIIPAKFTRGPALAPSFNYANSKEKNYAREAVEKASDLINKGWVGLALVTKNVAARNAYELYFGPFDQNRFNTVKRNYKTMHDVLCSDSLHLYYRTGKAVGKATDVPGASGNISQLVGSHNIDVIFAYVLNPSPAPGVHMFLCKAFFEATHLDRGNDAIGGVFVHELSHTLCGTHDHAYGPGPCQALTDDEKIENADNYEYFAESFVQ